MAHSRKFPLMEDLRDYNEELEEESAYLNLDHKPSIRSKPKKIVGYSISSIGYINRSTENQDNWDIEQDQIEDVEKKPQPKCPMGINHDDVLFSLNKKGRWKVVEDCRENLSSLQTDDVKISLKETDIFPFDHFGAANDVGSWGSRGYNHSTRAYHTMIPRYRVLGMPVEDMSQEQLEDTAEAHYYPNGKYGVFESFAIKENAPSKERKKNKRNAARVAARIALEKTAQERLRKQSRGSEDNFNQQEESPEPEPSTSFLYTLLKKMDTPEIFQKSFIKSCTKEHKKDRFSDAGQFYAYRKRAKKFDADGFHEYESLDSHDFLEDVLESDSEKKIYSPAIACLVFLTTSPRASSLKARKLRRKRNDTISVASSSTADSLSICSFSSGVSTSYCSDNHYTGLLEKPWIRQLSEQPEEDEGFEEIHMANELPAPALRQYFHMSSAIVRIGYDDLASEFLKAEFGSNYYECATIPRRFVLEISSTVCDIMTIAHGHQASVKHRPKVYCVFEVEATSLSTMKLWEKQEQWNFVEVSLNGSFTEHINENFQMENVLFEGLYSIREILKNVSMAVATLPLSYFEMSQSGEDTLVKNSKTKEQSSFMTKCLEPNDKLYLSPREANDMALQETSYIRKLQRQLTAVSSYSFFDMMEDAAGNCEICYADSVTEIGFCLANCRHWFCNDCWREYCQQQMQSSIVPIRCPDVSCDEVVDCDILTTVLPFLLCKRYEELLSEQHFLKNSRNWIWCPNPKCGKVVKTANPQSNILTCTCGHLWCTECKGPVHWPVSCEHAERYLEKVKSQGDDLNERQLQTSGNVVRVKRCPHCRLQMEKSYGCNHMICRCGKAFCWSCVKIWDSGSHYDCPIESEKTVEVAVLRDDQQKVDCSMKVEYYNNSVVHRKARFPEQLQVLRKGLRKVFQNPQRMSSFQDMNQKRVDFQGEMQRMQQTLKNGRFLIEELVGLYNQTHQVLEFVNVWLYFEKRQLKTATGLLIQGLKERLQFAIDFCLFDSVVSNGTPERVLKTKSSIESLLKQLIFSVKFSKSCSDSEASVLTS